MNDSVAPHSVYPRHGSAPLARHYVLLAKILTSAPQRGIPPLSPCSPRVYPSRFPSYNGPNILVALKERVRWRGDLDHPQDWLDDFTDSLRNAILHRGVGAWYSIISTGSLAWATLCPSIAEMTRAAVRSLRQARRGREPGSPTPILPNLL